MRGNIFAITAALMPMMSSADVVVILDDGDEATVFIGFQRQTDKEGN